MIDDPTPITSTSHLAAHPSRAFLILLCTVLSSFGAPEPAHETLLAAGNTETPLASPEKARSTPPTLDEALQSVAGVYLCELRDDGGHLQLYVSAVWLHHPRLGPPPPAGTKLLSVRTPNSHPGVKEMVVFYYNPPVRPGVTASYIDVVEDRVPMFKLSLEETEKKVRAASPKN